MTLLKFDKKFSERDAKRYKAGSKTNATIVAGEGEYLRTFHVNKDILAYRCEYFRSCFFGNFSESRENKIQLNSVRGDVMEIILFYLHCGYVSGDTSLFLEVYMAADMLGVEGLTDFLEECASLWVNTRNALQILNTAELSRPWGTYVLSYVLHHAKACFESADFLSITEALLMYLFGEDELNLSEEEVWHCTMTWGRSTAMITGDSCTDDDIEKIKHAVRNILPLIRFDQMSVEFLTQEVRTSRVIPISKLIGIYESLLLKKAPATTRHHVCLALVSFQQAQELRSFLPKHQRLTLLYNAKTDGSTPADFHRLCDNQGATIVICTEGSIILGGYAPHSWDAIWMGKPEYSDRSMWLFASNELSGTVTKYPCPPTYIGPTQGYEANYGPRFRDFHVTSGCTLALFADEIFPQSILRHNGRKVTDMVVYKVV